MKRFLKSLAMFLAIVAIAASCEKNIEPENPDEPSAEEKARRNAIEKAQKYLRDDIFKTYYYWYDQMNSIAASYKTDIYNFFDKLLVKKDRWSWMMDGPSYIADESGVVYGTYGVSLGQLRDPSDPRKVLDYDIAVRFVYPGSPFEKEGVKRGWILNAIDDKSVDNWLSSEEGAEAFNDLLNYPSTTEAHKFGFIDNDGEYKTFSLKAAETLTTRPCLAKAIFTAEDYPGLKEKVGYFNYLSFKADNDASGKNMLEDITEPMQYFKENGVKTLIVDLRYNGGGDSRASDLLVSYLAPKSARGKIYVKRTHNKLCSSLNQTQTIDAPLDVISALEKEDKISFSCKPDSPEFEHLYFITGYGSASASEMSLNGLKPLADVHHVGGVTYGKPNGMYVFLYPYEQKHRTAYDRGDYSALEYVFLPICFYNMNGQGTEIPDTGMVPDDIRYDDIFNDFGPGEGNIAACLHHIVNGTYPAATSPKSRASVQNAKRVKIALTPEEIDQNYGKYTVKPRFFEK
ncbi:MAG: hypothetical protein J5693_03765 [Bacteroidales bacterium]|nr:hypothetical protein [Bacteroidales bacterium]